MVMLDNNLFSIILNMKKVTINKRHLPSTTFFPRIIREFDDGPDDKPMMYGGE